jgi:hypothetical protein
MFGLMFRIPSVRVGNPPKVSSSLHVSDLANAAGY